MKTGNTASSATPRRGPAPPQWSPVMKTGNTTLERVAWWHRKNASMEPGHEDREYKDKVMITSANAKPQWSPVMKTGNTPTREPAQGRPRQPQWSPVMKTGNT